MARMLVVCLVLLAGEQTSAQAQPRVPSIQLEGKTLSAALLELQALGLRIVFTSEVVRPDMRVTSNPSATDPRSILDQILAPHGLEVESGSGETLIVVASIETPEPVARRRFFDFLLKR